jgi:hypothetical protein
LNPYIKYITLLLFIYNTILGYVVIEVTAPSVRLPMLALILVDYAIIYYFIARSVPVFFRHRRKRGRIAKRR